MKLAGLWSGGKDSCFACYKALAEGNELAVLFNFTDSHSADSLSHCLPAGLITDQAGLTGIPLAQKQMPWSTYRRDFQELIATWKEKAQIEGIVFGDIYLEEHRLWIEDVCRESKIKAIFPLWGRDTAGLLAEIIDCDFTAIVVTVQAGRLDKSWLGRAIDRKFLEDLPAGIDPCGEKGEYHSLILAGPIFKKGGIVIEKGEPFTKEEDKRWFLKIKKYTSF